MVLLDLQGLLTPPTSGAPRNSGASKGCFNGGGGRGGASRLSLLLC